MEQPEIKNGNGNKKLAYIIKYPIDFTEPKEESKIQMRILRFIKNNNWTLEKVTGKIILPITDKHKLLELETLGADITPIEPDLKLFEKTKLEQKFNILNNLFEKAINENESKVIEFLMKNLSETEMKLLQEK